MTSRSPRSPRLTLSFYSSSTFTPAELESQALKSPQFGDCEQELDSKERRLQLIVSKDENCTSDLDDRETESLVRGEFGDCILHDRDIAMHVAILETKLNEETQAKNRFSLALAELEKRMLEKDKEMEILKLGKQEIESECRRLREELEITSKHLNTIEISFNDVHEKYERAKQTIQILNHNVELLKESLTEHDLCISQKHEQYLKLKEHAMERMDFANSQLDLIERKYTLETLKLRGALKEAELGARLLSEQLEQRNKDNVELTSICDGLIEKMDSQRCSTPGLDKKIIRSEIIDKLEF